MKMGVNNNRKLTNSWKHLNENWSRQKLIKKIEDFLEMYKNVYATISRLIGYNEGCSKRQVHRTKCLPERIGKISY